MIHFYTCSINSVNDFGSDNELLSGNVEMFECSSKSFLSEASPVVFGCVEEIDSQIKSSLNNGKVGLLILEVVIDHVSETYLRDE